jgi:curved DNA-binding protein CbpA
MERIMAEILANPYAVLGLDRTATLEEIKNAYFAQVRQHPPERDPEAFKRIRTAYDRLRDPEKRVEVDMGLLEEWPGPARLGRLPQPDLCVCSEDVLAIAAVGTDLARTDFHADFREVSL